MQQTTTSCFRVVLDWIGLDRIERATHLNFKELKEPTSSLFLSNLALFLVFNVVIFSIISFSLYWHAKYWIIFIICRRILFSRTDSCPLALLYAVVSFKGVHIEAV